LENKGLTIVDFNFKDIDRFRTFYNIAKESGKKMVISFKHACFLDRYHLDDALNVPHSGGENIFIFKPKLMRTIQTNISKSG
jgi:mRNA degradation ribonuclease J1/J2